jgi:2-isopropylmalate synthase
MHPPFFKLVKIEVSVGTGKEPRAEAQVFHAKTGSTATEVSTGDGPVDALYNAIDGAVGSPHKLVSYSIRSVSEGSDAVGEATVLLSVGDVLFRGVARDTDVLRASADAYVKALNKMEAHRIEEESQGFVRRGIIDSFQNRPE